MSCTSASYPSYGFRFVFGSVFVAVLVISMCTALAVPLGDIDQQNVGTEIYSNGAIAPFSFGQSFTPTFDGVDAFDFLLGGSDASTVVRIRDGVAGADGLSGNIIAVSLPTIVEYAGDEWFHFDFANRVSLIPGREYVAELHYTTGSLGTRSTIGNYYSSGQLFQHGWPTHFFGDGDLIFREGLHVPEPAGIVLLLCGLAVVSRRFC